MASTSMFVACKDYDDDIKNLQAQIDKAALQTDLQALKTSLESELSTLKASLATAQAELAQKADKSALEALADKVTKLTERVSTIETQIKAINEALDKKADKAELAALEAALTGKLDNLEKVLSEKLDAEEAARKAEDIKLQAAIDAANKNIELQKQALEAAKTALEAKDAELEALIGANAEAIEALKTKMAAAEAAIKKIQEETIPALEADIAANTSDIATLKEKMQDAAEDIIALQEEVDVLNVLVTKQLTSLVLMPAFYWEGLEAIEAPYIKETPLFAEWAPKDGYTFNYKLQGAASGDKTVKVWVEKIMTLRTDAKDNTKIIAPADLTASLEGSTLWIDKQADKKSLTAENLAAVAGGANKYVKKNIARGGVAKYHVNPATVDLSNTTIEFFTNFAEVYTRGDEATKPFAWAIKENAADNELKGGILTIPFQVDDAVLAATFANWAKADNQAAHADWDVADNASNGQKLPFIAAQLTDENDRVVTSDYAVVVPAEYKIIALADKAPEEALSRFTFLKAGEGAHIIRQNHLYESVGYENCEDAQPFEGPTMNAAKGLGAIPMPATHSVAYDSKIDLADFVETHYDYTTYAKYGKSTTDQVMDKATMEALGLSYNFTVINYTVGTNKTSESAHIQQDATSKSVFYPRSVDRNGNTIENETATREVIGREPLIRVDLVDADGDIIRYGYIKLRITDKEVQTNDISVEIALGEMWMDCGDSAKVTWSQMENQILRELNMTKQEFEAAYYLQVVGTATAAVTDMPTNANGSLYKKAADNGRFAVRYYKNADGKYVIAGPKGTASVGNFTYNDELTYTDDEWKTVTVDNNWFGRVWYTPHDNSTNGHDWDENTNVLVWNFGNANDKGDNLKAADAAAQSNMQDNADYQHMIKVVEASFENKGVNANAVSTVVRFINKNTGASVWVTLKFAPQTIHFATAAINRRVLDHWYSMTEGYKDGVADTIEVYANVPTPAEHGQVALTTADFEKDLKEYWLEKKVVADLYNKDKFGTHFYDAENDAFIGDITFQFRLPEEGVNADFSADENGEWKVKGISGIEYTLYLSASKKYIMVKKNEAAGMTHDQGLCYLTANGRIHFYGRINPTSYLYSPGINGNYEADPTDNTVNGPASDILNYIGMYDAQGNQQKDFYLTKQKDKTFTAFVEIKVSNDACYDPIIGHNYFNVRFLRPINVWAAGKEIVDAPNAAQFINIWELINIKDWRTYGVVMDNMAQTFTDGKKYSGLYNDKETTTGGVTTGKSVPYTFYGISNLFVKRNQIRSDAYLEPTQRTTVLTKPEEIAALRSIKDIPALTNGNLQYLKIIEKGNATADYTLNTPGKVASTDKTDVIAYTNNGGVVKEFHIYVPIAVEYPWGALHGKLPEWTQTVWAVITVKPTTGNE